MHRKTEEESITGSMGDEENAAGRLGGAYVKRLRMLDTWWVDPFSDTTPEVRAGRRKHEKGPA